MSFRGARHGAASHSSPAGIVPRPTQGQLEGLALICDCDGVLIDSEAVVCEVIVGELLRRWPDADVAPVVVPLLGRRIVQVLEMTAASFGRALSAEDVREIRSAAVGAAIQAPMVEEVDAALAGIPLLKACASNSLSSYVSEVLHRTCLATEFEHRTFTGDMVINPKPAPDVYVLAARSLGLPPQRCLVVEDSAAGAAAACAAGMTVFGYVGGAHDPEGQAARLRLVGVKQTFGAMSQLPQLAEEWVSALVH